MTLRMVADRLYGLTPAEFTHVRDAEAAAAKASGDAELAAAIKALRKPSMSAWSINSLVRQALEELDELLAVGADLRAAQQGSASDDLRRLTRERRRLASVLLGVAGDLAAQEGHRLSAAVARDIGATLDAAVSDVGAAAAVRSGRLVRALAPGGFDAVDVDGAVALPDAVPAVPVHPRMRLVQASATVAARRPSAAQRALEVARESAAMAERAVTKANSALDTATAKAEAAGTVAEEAERAWTAARDHLAQAETARDSAERERDAAVHSRDEARRAVQRAEAAVKKNQ